MPLPAVYSQFVLAAVKMVYTNCVCSGAQWAPCALTNHAAQIHWHETSEFVIARPRRGRGNLAVPGWITGRPRTPRALPRASRSGRHVGLWPPRNDNSGAITVLSSAGTNRKRCAGSGMPLPYNARLAVLRNFPFSILHFPFAPCLAPAICTAFHNKKLPHPVGCGSGRVFLTC